MISPCQRLLPPPIRTRLDPWQHLRRLPIMIALRLPATSTSSMAGSAIAMPMRQTNDSRTLISRQQRRLRRAPSLPLLNSGPSHRPLSL